MKKIMSYVEFIMVHIEFGEDAVEFSSRCWRISDKIIDKKTGEVSWVPSVYCSSLGSCLHALLEMRIRRSDAKGFAELTTVYRNVSSDIESICGALGYNVTIEPQTK